MNSALLGAIAMASLVAGLFFLRFWKDTKDRLFLFFSISFFVEGLNRFALAMVSDPNDCGQKHVEKNNPTESSARGKLARSKQKPP
jgi:Family of unknown function (DUF5985)